MKGRYKKGDIIIIALVLLMALSIFLICTFGIFSKNGNEAILRYEGGEKRISLNENTEFSFESYGYSLTLKAENGGVYIARSDCPDKVCVCTPAISRTGQVIACVPARVTLRISGEGGSYDFVAG